MVSNINELAVCLLLLRPCAPTGSDIRFQVLDSARNTRSNRLKDLFEPYKFYLKTVTFGACLPVN